MPPGDHGAPGRGSPRGASGRGGFRRFPATSGCLSPSHPDAPAQVAPSRRGDSKVAPPDGSERWGVRAARSLVFNTEITEVRRETGKRRGCKSFTMKGRANHIGPESCASRREVWGEALTGAPMGQVLSRESLLFRDADVVSVTEGSTVGRVIASALPVPRGLRPWHVGETSCPGTGRSQVRPPRKGRSAPGRPDGRSR